MRIRVPQLMGMEPDANLGATTLDDLRDPAGSKGALRPEPERKQGGVRVPCPNA